MATVYVRNLNEKLNLRDLQEQLRTEFEKYGEVLQVVAKKSLKMRGQAFIDYADPDQAQDAINALNGADLFGKAIQVDHAKSPSDLIWTKTHGDAEERKAARKSTDSQPVKRVKGENPPHKVLFLQNLPKSVTIQDLEAVYSKDSGFVEARVFAAKGVGFIEFNTTEDATVALGRPQLEIGGQNILVSYANK